MKIPSSNSQPTLTPDALVKNGMASSFERLAQGQPNLVNNHVKPPSSIAKKLIALPAYYWVLITQVAVIFPHAANLPLWLMGFAAISIIAQLPQVKAKFASFTPAKSSATSESSTASRLKLKPANAQKRLYQGVQMFGFLLGLLGLWLTYKTAFGLDMGVAFLLLCLISKLWELYRLRDAYVVLNLSLFVLAALFLMDQGLMTTLEVIIGTLLVLLAFIALNDDGNQAGSGRLRTLGILSISAVPLLVVLFLFFPRLPPLWSVQLSGNQATTGVSNSMSPGDFANLGQSTTLAFRVDFKGARPDQSELYWRGLVFSDFDGVTWRPDYQNQAFWQWSPNRQTPTWLNNALATAPDSAKLEPSRYEIILEPTQQRWLFGLDYPLSQRPDVAMTSNFTLVTPQPVTQQLRYEALKIAPMVIDPILTDADKRLNLALPNTGNAKSKQLAKQLFSQSGNDPLRYIQALERWINRENFRYTLSPPKLDRDRIDSFLFGTRAGFCEHYSSSFTFMMRAAGIPARVVAGYQGGELSRGGNVWEVRQMDAHAWSEVWLENQGWVRVDPTAFVAPERVEQGMDSLTQSRGASMFGSGAGAQLSYQQYQLLQSLHRLSDQASYYWQKDIVGYDQDKQSNALLKWFHIKTITQQILWLAITAAIIMTLIAIMIWLRRCKYVHPADKALVMLNKNIGNTQSELLKNDVEGQLAWLKRLQDALSVDNEPLQSTINEVMNTYRQLRYGRLSQLDQKDPDYKQALEQLNRQVKALQSMIK